MGTDAAELQKIAKIKKWDSKSKVSNAIWISNYFIIVQDHFLACFRRRVCGPIEYMPVVLTLVFAECASVKR